MKPGLLYSIIALAAIIIVAGFSMQIGAPNPPAVPESMLGNVLYVCPVTNSTWDAIAFVLRPFINYVVAGFFFGLVLLAFGWGWQLYQNMLDDKFKRESFKNIWFYTKWGFWAAVIVTLLLITPNSVRRVTVDGDAHQWVLCESTTSGAVAVPAKAVHHR